MSPEQIICAACGSRAEEDGARRAKCPNPSCPTGGTVYMCEFCEKFAVSRQIEGLMCHNPKCRMYNLLRKVCPDCSKISRITYQGADLCLNRRCPSHKRGFDKCFYCHKPAVAKLPDFNACLKGHCKRFLTPTTACAFCNKPSHNIEMKVCENTDCRMHNVRVDVCPSCGERTRVIDPKHPENGSCLSAKCMSKKMDKSLKLSGTLLLAPDELEELDKIIGDGGGAGAPAPSGAFDPTMIDSPRSAPDMPPISLGAPDGRSGLPPTIMEGMPGVAEEGPKTSANTWLKNLERDAAEAGGAAGSQASGPSLEDILSGAQPIPQSAPEADSEARKSGLKLAESGSSFDAGGAFPSNGPPAGAKPVPVGGLIGIQGDTDATMAMAPGASAPAEAAAAPAGASAMESYEIESSPVFQAFAFVKEYILKEEGKRCPMYLVIGTAGAGKTTYLTMLGEILRARDTKYHFPFEGIDLRRIQVEQILAERHAPTNISPEMIIEGAKRHVRDLVFEFAQKEHTSTISRMNWPEHTPPDEASSFFLVTELRRYQKTLAKIVTFETSGEDFEAALRGITEYDPKSTTDKPIQKVLFELMSLADGFVILMVPEGRDNDEIYRNFFLAVRDGLEPRALNAFAAELRKRGAGDKKAGAEEAEGIGSTMMINAALLQGELSKQKDDEVRKRRKEMEEQLRLIRLKLQKGEVEALASAEGLFLRKVERALLAAGVKAIAEKHEQLKKLGATRERILAYYQIILEFIEKNDKDLARIDEMLGQPGAEAGGADQGEAIPAEEYERLLLEIRNDFGLSEDFRIAQTPELLTERPVARFRNLKQLSLVFTKTDMYAATYPPENYPSKRLPSCNMYLRMVEDYLRLIGGSIRYYNASATGYSVLRNTLYLPGPENTMTPINVVEPLFDMLGVQ